MNFDLTDDQVALRDGIRSLCEGRFPMKRVRAGFDRDAFAELAEAGVFSLRADGFGTADAAVVFEELGRAVLPGPLVWSALAHGAVDGIVGGIETTGRTAPWMVEHLDDVDGLLVLAEDRVTVVAAGALAGAVPVERPLDPLTPLHRVDALPTGDDVGGPELATTIRRHGAVLTAAFLVGIAQAAGDLAVAYAQERRQFDRPIGSFQAVKHLLADTAVRAEIARTSVHAAACFARRPRARRRRARRGGRQAPGGRGRRRQLPDLRAGARRHGLHLGGRRPPVPEAGVAARHRLRLHRPPRRHRRRQPAPTLTDHG